MKIHPLTILESWQCSLEGCAFKQDNALKVSGEINVIWHEWYINMSIVTQHGMGSVWWRWLWLSHEKWWKSSLKASLVIENLIACFRISQNLRQKKVKVTLVQALRLCRGRKAHRESKGVAILFLDHGNRMGWGVSVTPWLLVTQGKTRYPLYKRLGGLQGRSGQVRKISPPQRFDPRTVQPVASRYTDWATGPLTRFISF